MVEEVTFLGRKMKRQSEIDALLGEEKPMSVLETKARIVLRMLRVA